MILTAADGLLSEECTGNISPAGTKLADGKLCFATLKGIVLVDPKQVASASPPPSVWIEDVLVDGAPQNISATNRSLVISPGWHRFEFHYTGLNFAAPSQVRFRYQMEGLDKDWVEADRQRSAFYNYIPPGGYHFRVVACNNDGIWNETPTTLAFTVQPFVWQRPWFPVVVGLTVLTLVAGAIALVARRKLIRERARLAALHAIEVERTRIAKDIHDDLGATLSAIRMLSRFAQSPDTSEKRMREDMRQIAAKAFDSTQSLDEIVWAVDPQADTLESFINYACAFANEQLALADIRCRLDLPAEFPKKNLRADVRHNLFLAFKEAVNNVVKHASASEVHIQMESSPRDFTIAVIDNGCGLPAVGTAPPSPVATGGHGLSNLRARLKEIGGHCEMESRPGQGTTVRLHIQT